MFRKLRGGALVGLGYLLSPLSWWNDLFFNLPIAYLFGYGVAWLNADWFLPATVGGYWLSNVLGFVLMQLGVTDVLSQDRPHNFKREVLIGIGTSTIYTGVVAALVYFHVLEAQIPGLL